MVEGVKGDENQVDVRELFGPTTAAAGLLFKMTVIFGSNLTGCLMHTHYISNLISLLIGHLTSPSLCLEYIYLHIFFLFHCFFRAYTSDLQYA